MEVICDEVLTQPFFFVGTISQDGLLNGVLKEPFDEGGLGFWAVDEEFTQVAGVSENQLFAILAQIATAGINGTRVFLGTITTDRVEVLHGEAQGINHIVTGLAAAGFRLFTNAFTGAELGI